MIEGLSLVLLQLPKQLLLGLHLHELHLILVIGSARLITHNLLVLFNGTCFEVFPSVHGHMDLLLHSLVGRLLLLNSTLLRRCLCFHLLLEDRKSVV